MTWCGKKFHLDKIGALADTGARSRDVRFAPEADIRLWGKTEFQKQGFDLCLWHKADVQSAFQNVRFSVAVGHRGM
jgi:hypothetical protein